MVPKNRWRRNSPSVRREHNRVATCTKDVTNFFRSSPLKESIGNAPGRQATRREKNPKTFHRRTRGYDPWGQNKTIPRKSPLFANSSLRGHRCIHPEWSRNSGRSPAPNAPETNPALAGNPNSIYLMNGRSVAETEDPPSTIPNPNA